MDPIKPMSKAPGIKRFEAEIQQSAFKFYLRCYSSVPVTPIRAFDDPPPAPQPTSVCRCSLTLSNPR